MRRVVDASALVAEGLRERGRAILAHQDTVILIAEPAWPETLHELRKRVDAIKRHQQMQVGDAESVSSVALDALNRGVTRVPERQYHRYQAEARARIPRDPTDWPTVAAAMHLDAGIWTNDCDVLGCGLPTWATETLLVRFIRRRGRPA